MKLPSAQYFVLQRLRCNILCSYDYSRYDNLMRDVSVGLSFLETDMKSHVMSGATSKR